MFDVKEARKTWESNPVFWSVLAVVVVAFLVIFAKFFFGLIGIAVAYAFFFGLFGIALYIVDFKTVRILGRRMSRLLVAGAIALLWAGFRSSGLMSLAGHLILAVWSFTVLFVSFSLGVTIWKNREVIAQRFEEVVRNPANAGDAIRDAAGATKTSVKEGFADARKATIG